MSSDFEFEKKVDEETASLEKHNRGVRRRNLLILALAVAAVLFAIVCLYLASENHRLAVANAEYGATKAQEKQTLGQEVTDTLCQEEVKTDAVAQACRNAKKAASEPTPGPQGVQGIQGIQGIPGPPGEDGRDGAQGPPGPTGPKGERGDTGAGGPAGANGEAGTDGQPGTNGATGATGPEGPPGPAGPAGPPGADSTAPGPTGPTGPQGEPGRGIASSYCGDDGRWTITYTDGAMQDGGQCRTTILPVR